MISTNSNTGVLILTHYEQCSSAFTLFSCFFFFFNYFSDTLIIRGGLMSTVLGRTLTEGLGRWIKGRETFTSTNSVEFISLTSCD